MISSGFHPSSTLDELESHLREEISAQLGKGLTAEQSFLAAVQQIGPAASLRKEFGKTTTKSALEYKIGKLLVVIGFAIYGALSIKGLFFNTVDVTPTQKILGLSAVLITFVFGLLSISLWRVTPVITNKVKRVATAIGVAVFGAAIAVVLFWVVMPAFDFNIPQVIVMTLWAMVPLVIGGTVSSAIIEAADRRLTAAA